MLTIKLDSLESMGSEAEISGLNNGSGDPPCAAPIYSELEETANPQVTTSVSGMGKFDFMDSESESIFCLGMSSASITLEVDQSLSNIASVLLINVERGRFVGWTA